MPASDAGDVAGKTMDGEHEKKNGTVDAGGGAAPARTEPVKKARASRWGAMVRLVLLSCWRMDMAATSVWESAATFLWGGG